MTTATIARLSRAEKLRIMEALWADLSQDAGLLESPAWHANALKDAEAEVKSGRAKFVAWETAKRQLSRPRK
ncbi:MAG TPA: addiction module protein [Opitutales bacterium]|nr:addiction module protein [Opitutales bacterium]